jgi:hypothetical protein
MGLVVALNGLRDYLINYGITGIDEYNCTVDDESIFNSILERMNPDEQRGIIVSYAGLRKNNNQPSEFGGNLQYWIINLNAFFLLWGNIEDRSASINSAWAFVDELTNAIVADSTLDDSVMDCVILRADEPVLYTRQQMNEYLMLGFTIAVMENLL